MTDVSLVQDEGRLQQSAFVVGVAGTHSTGKTTFLKQLGEKFEAQGLSIESVGDLATAARDAGFGILREHTYESTLWIISRGMSEELAAATTADVVLVDRPIPDALGYLRAALAYRGDSLLPEQWEYLKVMTQGYAGRYHLMFKTTLDPSVPIDTTKERDSSQEYRVQVADHIDSVFEDLALSAYELERTGWTAAVELCLQCFAAHRALNVGGADETR